MQFLKDMMSGYAQNVRGYWSAGSDGKLLFVISKGAGGRGYRVINEGL